jgi:hypothetical protein
MDTSMFGPKLNSDRSKNYRGIERMTSPTTNLAADLSENFHIEQTLVSVGASDCRLVTNYIYSPVLPTPRRSLFANLKSRCEYSRTPSVCVHNN